MTRPEIPTLYVIGTAEREVTPDQVEVTLTIATPLHTDAVAALAEAAQMRARVTTAMRTQLPDVAVADRRITVREEEKTVERRSGYQTYESHREHRGYTGHCEVILRAGAERAAELVAHGGAHPDVAEIRPAFTLSADLRRTAQRELEGDAVRDGLERAGALAVAAGGRVAEIVSIGEWLRAGDDEASDGWQQARFAMNFAIEDHSPQDILDALGEMRPEPVRRSASVPVRVALTFA